MKPAGCGGLSMKLLKNSIAEEKTRELGLLAPKYAVRRSGPLVEPWLMSLGGKDGAWRATQGGRPGGEGLRNAISRFVNAVKWRRHEEGLRIESGIL